MTDHARVGPAPTAPSAGRVLSPARDRASAWATGALTHAPGTHPALALQRAAGNRSVARLLAGHHGPVATNPAALHRTAPGAAPLTTPATATPTTVRPPTPVQRDPGSTAGGAPAVAGPAVEDDTAAAGTFILDDQTITSYADATRAVTWWRLMLLQERDDLQRDGAAVPAGLQEAADAAVALADLWGGGESEPLDRGNARELRDWHARYVRVVNGARAETARVAAQRARAAADDLRAGLDRLEQEVLPLLREAQRTRFRDGDEEGLATVADGVAGILDTALVTKDAITRSIEVAAELRMAAGTASTSRTVLAVTRYVPGILEAVEKVNQAYAAFQLVRDSLNVIGGHTTEAGRGTASLSLMATTVSAGGTLLGASVGFTLYSNLYVGPMVARIVTLLDRLFNDISRTRNRHHIQMGEYRYVAWDLEPGGRAMFDFALATVRAASASQVPAPRGDVRDYLVDRADALSAGVGARGGELPTTGMLFWEDVDDERIQGWAFRNRQSLWAMLYGDCPVPTD